jgi:hypothetical protein
MPAMQEAGETFCIFATKEHKEHKGNGLLKAAGRAVGFVKIQDMTSSGCLRGYG